MNNKGETSRNTKAETQKLKKLEYNKYGQLEADGKVIEISNPAKEVLDKVLEFIKLNYILSPQNAEKPKIYHRTTPEDLRLTEETLPEVIRGFESKGLVHAQHLRTGLWCFGNQDRRKGLAIDVKTVSLGLKNKGSDSFIWLRQLASVPTEVTYGSPDLASVTISIDTKTGALGVDMVVYENNLSKMPDIGKASGNSKSKKELPNYYLEHVYVSPDGRHTTSVERIKEKI